MQYHAFRAVWCARAAAIPDKVLGTSLEVSTVRVMAVMMTTVLIIVSVQVVTHGDAAGFDYPGCLILTSVRFVGEAFGALFFLLRLSIFFWHLFIIIIIILLLLVFCVFGVFLVFWLGRFFSFPLLIFGVSLVSWLSTSLFSGCWHGKLLLLLWPNIPVFVSLAVDRVRFLINTLLIVIMILLRFLWLLWVFRVLLIMLRMFLLSVLFFIIVFLLLFLFWILLCCFWWFISIRWEPAVKVRIISLSHVHGRCWSRCRRSRNNRSSSRFTHTVVSERRWLGLWDSHVCGDDVIVMDAFAAADFGLPILALQGIITLLGDGLPFEFVLMLFCLS